MSKDSALQTPNPRFNNFHQINKPREQPVMIEIETTGERDDLVVQGKPIGKPVVGNTNPLTGHVINRVLVVTESEYAALESAGSIDATTNYKVVADT